MITVTLEGDAVLVARLDRLPAELREACRVVIERAVGDLRSYIFRQKFRGRPLHASRGELHRSITTSVEDEAHAVVGKVGVVGEARAFVGVLEYASGPVFVRAHARQPGAWVRGWSYDAKRRSFLRSALRENRARIVRELRAAVRDAVQKR